VRDGALTGAKCEFTFVNMKKDPEARRAVLLMISRGQASVPELAQLAGVSRHLIRRWCASRGISVDRARKARLVKAWRRTLTERP
jgi:transposase-like protein